MTRHFLESSQFRDLVGIPPWSLSLFLCLLFSCWPSRAATQEARQFRFGIAFHGGLALHRSAGICRPIHCLVMMCPIA